MDNFISVRIEPSMEGDYLNGFEVKSFSTRGG